jgi:uncharacterized protein (DUF2336 family)
MFGRPAARPSSTLHENATMTSERLSADSTTTSSVTCARRRILVRKYVKGNATTMQTAPARRETQMENRVRSSGTLVKTRCQLASSNAGS